MGFWKWPKTAVLRVAGKALAALGFAELRKRI